MARTIKRKEYEALSKEEKKNWVPYTIESDPEIQKQLTEAELIKKATEMVKPVSDKTKFIPNDLPIEKLTKTLDKLNNLMTVQKVVEKITSAPIIGQLAAPVAEALQSIIDILGSAFYIIFAIARGQEIFFDNVNKIINNVQWEDLETAMNELKKKKKKRKRKIKKPKNIKKNLKNLLMKKQNKLKKKFQKKLKKHIMH